MRPLFVQCALLVLLFTGAALAGQYQRTRDERTLVWDEDHKPGDSVSWSGKRDADGYATGYGTLTWYTPEDAVETGSNLPRKRYTILSRVSGTMAQGKFEEARGTEQAAVEAEKPKKKGWFSFLRLRRKPSPAPIEATATPTPRLKSRPTHIEETPQQPSLAPTNAEAAPTPTPKSTSTPGATSNSLDSLMHAPSSLRLNSPAASPSPSSPSSAATPDVSLQPEAPTSPSPTPQ